MAKLFTIGVWTDEILAGVERFDILDNVGAPIESSVQIQLTTAVAIAGTLLTAAMMNRIETGVDQIDTLLDAKVTVLNDLIAKLNDRLFTAYTTTGTSTAYVITTPLAPALAVDERWRVIFNVTAGAAPTLNRDDKGAKPLMVMNAAGAKSAAGVATLIAGMRSDVVYDGTDYVIMDSLGAGGGGGGADPLETQFFS